MSNYFGQQVVEKFGHIASLSGSLILSFIPCLIFAFFMPETMGERGTLHSEKKEKHNEHPSVHDEYVVL